MYHYNTVLSFYSILILTLYNCIQMNGISTHLHVGADSTSYSHELPAAAAAEGEHYTGLARSTILLGRA